MTGANDPREALLELLLAETGSTAPERRGALSFSQRRIWFLRQLLGDRDASYNVPFAMRLRGALNHEALEYAVNQIVARHDGLRARFELADGEPVQVIAETVQVPVPVSRPDPADVPALISEHARHAFDLAAAPLLKVSVLTLGEDDHVLLLNMHHIIADGWSLACFVDELSLFYRSRVSGEPAHPPALPLQYDAFAAAQAREAAAGAFDPQLQYWLGRLSDGPEHLALPSDRPRPAQMSGRGGQVRFVTSGDVRDGLKAIAADSGATLYMVLLSALFVLLHRLTGENDLHIGSPVAGRSRPDVERLIGCFVNTVVMRAKIAPDATFKTLLDQVKRTALDAFDRQDLPFEVLVEHLRPRRSLGRTPVFQVMMALQNIPVSEFDLPGLTIEPIAQTLSIAKFDLNLNLAERPSGLSAVLEYNTDIFEPATAERLCSAYQELLAELCADGPDTPIQAFHPPALDRPRPGAGPAPRSEAAAALETAACAQISKGARGFLTAEPIDMTLAGPFEMHARDHPDDLALIAGDRRVSYGALARRARQIARLLQARGVVEGGCVAVCLPHGVAMVETLYAIAMTGASYAPIDPDLPAKRMAAMLKQINPALLVIGAAGYARGTADGWPSVVLEACEAEIEALSAEPLQVNATGGAPAYIMHTSGSSGAPKAVQFPADAAIRSMRSLQARYPTKRGDAHLFKTPFTFDVSIWELFWPLYHGAALVICEPARHGDPTHLRAQIEAHDVSVVNFVPSMLELFLSELEDGACRSLRWVLSGGERLSARVRDLCFERLPGARLANLYGPTETHCVADMELTPGTEGLRVPIGTASSAFTLHVLTDDLEPAPPGEPGELYVGGDGGMAHGYVGQPGLTAERFIPDPFGSPGARLYRTGDLCRIDAAGTLDFLGRRDRQLKLAGRRIEPGEIEQAVLSRHEVQACAVDAVGEGPGRRLAAFLVPGPGARIDAERLKAALSESLPAPLVPADFVMLDALPLTPHGKLDRDALESAWKRSLVQPGPATASAVQAGGLATQVQHIFEDVLGRSPLDPDTSFFELGGHSLMAIQVIARCRAQFAVALPLHVIYEASSSSALAREIDAARNRQARSLIKLAGPEIDGIGAVIVLLHGSDGTITPLLPLARALGDAVPVYGLEAPGVSAADTLCPTVRAYAEYYAPLLSAFCKSAEVTLVGWSFGGDVAVELTRALTEAGSPAAHTVLLDSFVVDAALSRDTQREAALKALKAYDFGGLTRRLRQDATGDELQDRLRIVLDNNLEAFTDYAPADIEAPIHLMTAADGWADAPTVIAGAYQDDQRGWSGRLRNLRLTATAGDHFSLIDASNSPALAKKILNLVRAEDRGNPR